MQGPILTKNGLYNIKNTWLIYMVDHEPKRPYEPFLMSEEDCMSFSSLVLMTILVICNIEVKQKQFFWHRKTARSPLGPP